MDEVKDVGAELDISGKMNQIMEEKMANFSMSRVERTELIMSTGMSNVERDSGTPRITSFRRFSSRFLTSAIAALLTFIALSVTLLSKLQQVCLISARSSVGAVDSLARGMTVAVGHTKN